MMAEPNEAIDQTYVYAPLGSIDYSEGTSDNTHQFTGKEIDEESGLIYFGARYYNPEIGRWISRDPIVGKILHPQSLNRYAYCYNNPFKYLDLDGRKPQEAEVGIDAKQEVYSVDDQGKKTRVNIITSGRYIIISGIKKLKQIVETRIKGLDNEEVITVKEITEITAVDIEVPPPSTSPEAPKKEAKTNRKVTKVVEREISKTTNIKPSVVGKLNRKRNEKAERESITPVRSTGSR